VLGAAGIGLAVVPILTFGYLSVELEPKGAATLAGFVYWIAIGATVWLVYASI